MPKERPSLKYVLDDLFKVFPFPDLGMALKDLKDPFECENTAELVLALRDNLEALERKEVEVLSEDLNRDRDYVNKYMENRDNFNDTQWEAIQKTRQAINEFERELEHALESGDIKYVEFDASQETRKKRRKRMKRFKGRKKWISL